MSRCAVFCTVAAIGLASNDRWSEHALSQVVGGFESIDVKETQEVRPVLAQAFGKASIVRIGEAARCSNQAIQSLFEILCPLGEGAGGKCRFLSFQSQCFLQQAGGLAGKVQRSSGFGLVHLLQVFQQMAEAFLFEPVVQSAVIVGQEPIGGQDAGEVIAQDVEDHIAAAVGADGVDGEITMCEDPQPGRERADPPAGLIGIHDTTLPDGLQQFFIHGSSGAASF